MRRLAWSSFILFFLACTHAKKSSTVDLTEKEITFRNGDVTLRGVVMARRAESPMPGAVIIHGSGTSHRGNRWAAAIARGLARRGVVVLLPDKRGSGESEGDWRSADFNVLAADALAGLHAIASEPKPSGRGDTETRRRGEGLLRVPASPRLQVRSSTSWPATISAPDGGSRTGVRSRKD